MPLQLVPYVYFPIFSNLFQYGKILMLQRLVDCKPLIEKGVSEFQKFTEAQ